MNASAPWHHPRRLARVVPSPPKEEPRSCGRNYPMIYNKPYRLDVTPWARIIRQPLSFLLKIKAIPYHRAILLDSFDMLIVLFDLFGRSARTHLQTPTLTSWRHTRDSPHLLACFARKQSDQPGAPLFGAKGLAAEPNRLIQVVVTILIHKRECPSCKKLIDPGAKSARCPTPKYIIAHCARWVECPEHNIITPPCGQKHRRRHHRSGHGSGCHSRRHP